MFRVWWGICIRLCYKFPTESNSERILKIGQYLLKLWARVRCLVFLTHGVDEGYCYRRRDVAWSLINPRNGIVLQTQLDDLCAINYSDRACSSEVL